ncbi:unnamed protein product [Thlaspi arvense]|uniref:Bifunctional inhibitor/plant lipid transfer protein/seed storage helical domain-containing protein n=1 Tax=Thlaspi arvense TaxID=13288 RepID=A0AAU9SXY5_THLAR|nr:unnamed protein product [Thlaspi arvense]
MAVFSAATSLLVLFLSISSPFVHVDSAPAVDCSTVVLSMVNCVAFVTIGGKDDQPSASCCSGLKKVLDVNPECLCEGLKNSDSLGVKVNVTKAATLPALCKLTAPPVSACACQIFSLCFSDFVFLFLLLFAVSGTPPASAPGT